MQFQIENDLLSGNNLIISTQQGVNGQQDQEAIRRRMLEITTCERVLTGTSNFDIRNTRDETQRLMLNIEYATNMDAYAQVFSTLTFQDVQDLGFESEDAYRAICFMSLYTGMGRNQVARNLRQAYDQTVGIIRMGRRGVD